VIRTALLLAACTAALAATADAAAPRLAIRASALVLPAKPSLAAGSRNVRGVYRVARGVYCVQTAPTVDWTRTSPYVTPVAARSAKGKGSLLAGYESGGQGCPAAAVPVRTFRVANGTLEPANDVAFELVVPAHG
jgi:hypothetical protein